MFHVKLFLCIIALLCGVTGVKVNMQGSLSLGKEVVDSIAHFMGRNMLSGRRSFNPPPIEDPITLVVKSALICVDLKFCQDDLQHFVNEYIIIIAKAVASIRSPDFRNEKYEEQLKHKLKDIKKLLVIANTNIKKDNKAYYWTHVIKKICALFQRVDNVIDSYISKTTDYNNKTQKLDKSELQHKIIIATVFIERKYQMKLCSEYNYCSKSHECTKALNKLLIHFKTLPEDKIRLFIKYFYEALFDSPFYSHINQETANEFQIILNDMSYSNDTSTKDIMLSVLKTVEARMEMLQLHKGLVVAHEILLAHIILSDIDHMFHNDTNAFTMFLNKFYDWMASNVQIDKDIRIVLTDISKKISLSEDDLVRKLFDEVKVFMEMTVNVNVLEK